MQAAKKDDLNDSEMKVDYSGENLCGFLYDDRLHVKDCNENLMKALSRFFVNRTFDASI